MKFIIWDTSDGSLPRCGDDGKIVSDGVVGRIEHDNGYLTIYGSYPNESRPESLAVGERIASVVFSLSGSSGIYDIYRVA